jgi:hypothetical protein
MSLVKDCQGKAHKLNYLFPCLSNPSAINHIIIYLQLLSLIAHFGGIVGRRTTIPSFKELISK